MGQNRFNEEMADLQEHVGFGYVDEILGEVKSGKEATVYCCRGGYRLPGRLIAAKIYRARMVRQFSNAATYNAGRNRQAWKREARAMATKTRLGRELAFGKWVADEYETLRLLHGAGVSVPQPFAMSERIILMEYIGDGEDPAPPLTNVALERGEAASMFSALIGEVELMLANDRVHGNLSPYNVLYQEGRGRIIDVPQAVDARFNQNALDLLDRDVDRLCAYFSRFDVTSDAWHISRGMWARYLRSEL